MGRLDLHLRQTILPEDEVGGDAVLTEHKVSTYIAGACWVGDIIVCLPVVQEGNHAIRV